MNEAETVAALWSVLISLYRGCCRFFFCQSATRLLGIGQLVTDPQSHLWPRPLTLVPLTLIHLVTSQGPLCDEQFSQTHCVTHPLLTWLHRHHIRFWIDLTTSQFQRSFTWLFLSVKSSLYMFQQCKVCRRQLNSFISRQRYLQWELLDANKFEIFPCLGHCFALDPLHCLHGAKHGGVDLRETVAFLWKLLPLCRLLQRLDCRRNCCCCKWSRDKLSVEQERWGQSEFEQHKLDLIKAGMLSGNVTAVDSVVSPSRSLKGNLLE